MLQKLRLAALHSPHESGFATDNFELDIGKFLALEPVFAESVGSIAAAAASEPLVSKSAAVPASEVPVSELAPALDLTLASFLKLEPVAAEFQSEVETTSGESHGAPGKSDAVAQELVERALESIRPGLIAEAKRLLRQP